MFQVQIAAGTGSSLALAQANYRFFLHIRNYQYAPGTINAQTYPIYVSFGKPATLGTKGELEIIAGSEYIWGDLNYGSNTYQADGCPTDAIYIITASGTTYGCILYNLINQNP